MFPREWNVAGMYRSSQGVKSCEQAKSGNINHNLYLYLYLPQIMLSSFNSFHIGKKLFLAYVFGYFKTDVK